VGELTVRPIGSLASLHEDDESILLSLMVPGDFRALFQPRARGAHKGDFGHVLVIGGSWGKTGAAAMAGLAALRAGAGLVTVASAESAIAVIASHAPELMTEPLPETPEGTIAETAHGRLAALMANKDVIALGPGIGTNPRTATLTRMLVSQAARPLVIDADGLNALAEAEWNGTSLVLTPHPGEMARLTGRTKAEVQADRIGVAREFATRRGLTLVLKGQRTLLALPDGRVRINPTGTPAMASGGSGDILTGLIAGLLAQFPNAAENAVAAAVWLHGRCGELGTAAYGEKPLIATDLLEFLPEAMDECAALPDEV
jgi:NAD(P)H-hydrate epimerase